MQRALVAAAMALAPGGSRPARKWTSKGLTDVPGIKVGHVTRSERPTGCTVILAEAGAVAGVDVRGSAPGTIETDLLDPVNLVQQVHAVFLSGGSAFGLDVATGVRKYLYERKSDSRRVSRGSRSCPERSFSISASADGRISGRHADCGYRAAIAASDGPVAEGNVGAGAGATVGKSGGGGRLDEGRAGHSRRSAMPDGLIVARDCRRERGWRRDRSEQRRRWSPACARRMARGSPTRESCCAQGRSRGRGRPEHDDRCRLPPTRG